MRTILLAASGIALAALLTACPGPYEPLSSASSPSSAFFAVPAALSADQGSRTLASDATVAAAVSDYYEYVRGQVRFGADIAEGIRSVLSDLEAVRYGDAFLLDSLVNATVLEGADTLRWTSFGGGVFSLEKWDAAKAKELELGFTREGSRYHGTVVIAGSVLPAPALGDKNPDMIYVAFDSADPAAGGAATLLVKASDFRAHPDLAWGLSGADESAAGQEDLVISLAKDGAGTVTLGSVAKVSNSRHFVWNGYDYLGVLDTTAAPETRYYAAAGTCSAGGLATVHLGIPAVLGADVFSSYGVGNLVAGLLTDRLNNDYTFDTTSTGHSVIATINSVPGVSPPLDGTTFANSPAAVVTALGQAKTWCDVNGPSDTVDYLVSMMGISNPAYFDASHYTGYGSTAPSTAYPALDDAGARALLPAVAEVDALASGSAPIVFNGSLAP